ncbi:DUF3316 domain-containing protein [Vibrio crassostreae]|uniref:hypothetical protein n=1 Tax=Vibrio TaxID=662 RepID=UPI0010BD062A|nr:hypothetical protein [Vibrio sp. F13]TKF71420.1 hypothetical protein FCV59_16895 [Vibrio sp. F13]CAK2396194.1 DUF3316 domain-containing protein [Vibrio crassostreae]CAK3923403.1 DUF3316 domain-containing protein [Vibrio crassostreae]
MNKVIAFLILISSFACHAGVTGAACAPDTGNRFIDATTAKALAKGQLSHELGTAVSAETSLKTVTEETQDSIETKDVLTETVNLSSKHEIKRVQTIFSGYKTFNGEKQYCVELSM